MFGEKRNKTLYDKAGKTGPKTSWKKESEREKTKKKMLIKVNIHIMRDLM